MPVENIAQRTIPWQLQNEAFGFVKLRASSKIPIEQSWQNIHHSFKEANNWINHGFNYGVMGGRGDLIVIDADTPQIIDLVESHLPKTFTVKSPRKGAHFYFLCPDITKKIVLKKVAMHYGEIIASGSQVVGAGSIHPDTGTGYQVINDVEIAKVGREDIYSALAECMTLDLSAKDKDAEIDHISVVDVLNKRNVQTKTIGDQIFCSHPVHGSSNGNNFVVNPEKNVWHCFRCNTGGGALSLIAVLEGVIDCVQAVSGALRGDKFNQVVRIAQEQYGFEVKRHASKEIPGGFFNDIAHFKKFAIQQWKNMPFSKSGSRDILVNRFLVKAINSSLVFA